MKWNKNTVLVVKIECVERIDSKTMSVWFCLLLRILQNLEDLIVFKMYIE